MVYAKIATDENLFISEDREYLYLQSRFDQSKQSKIAKKSDWININKSWTILMLVALSNQFQ